MLGLAAALAIRQHPGVAAAGPAHGMPLPAAARTPAFWLIYASLVLSCVGLFVPMVHLSPYAQDAGYSEAQGVALVSLIGLGSLLGRFTVGGIADRLGRMPSLAASELSKPARSPLKSTPFSKSPTKRGARLTSFMPLLRHASATM